MTAAFTDFANEHGQGIVDVVWRASDSSRSVGGFVLTIRGEPAFRIGRVKAAEADLREMGALYDRIK